MIFDLQTMTESLEICKHIDQTLGPGPLGGSDVDRKLVDELTQVGTWNTALLCPVLSCCFGDQLGLSSMLHGLSPQPHLHIFHAACLVLPCNRQT